MKKPLTKKVIDMPNPLGVRCRLKLFSTPAATDEARRNLTLITEFAQAGRPLPAEVLSWLERLSPQQLKKLRKAGFLTATANAHVTPLADLLARFVEEMNRKKRAPQHVGQINAHVSGLNEQAGFVYPGDITHTGVSAALDALAEKRGWNPRTWNSWLVDYKTFAHDLVKKGILYKDPVSGISKRNERLDRRKIRRELKPELIERLIAAALSSTTVKYRLTGTQRALLYVICLYGSWRWNEICHIRRRDVFLDEDQPRIAPPADIQKSRRDDIVVLRKDVAELLRRYFALNPMAPDDIILPMPVSRAGAKMIAFDLAATGDNPEVAAEKLARGETPVAPIPYVDDNGRVFDFHAFRHALSTMLERAGVPKGIRDQIMRHEADKSRMQATYTHLDFMDQSGALEQLPSVIPSGMLEQMTAQPTSQKTCQKRAKHIGQHRSESVISASASPLTSAKATEGEIVQVHEKTPTSEEAGVSQNWHPLRDSNPCSQTEKTNHEYRYTYIARGYRGPS